MAFTIRLPALFLLVVAASLSEVRADSLKQASVTEAVNTVSYQSSAEAPQKSASVGTTIYPDNIVRTGVKSRAELQFNDNTITRIGANSAFSFDADKQAMNLEEGTALFSKPKDNSSFEITTPAATCSISGTTGFLEVRPGKDKAHDSFIFGLIEGHTTVTTGGKSYQVNSGQLIVRTMGGSVNFVAFDIPSFLAKAGLLKDFKSKLPNQAYIDHAAAKFVSLETRGFIQPTRFSIGSNNQAIAFYAKSVGDFHQFNGITDQVNLIRQIQNFQGQVGQLNMMQKPGSGGFVDFGGTGIIHGQLVWTVDVDLDLHLILPNNAGQVYYGNPTITFNNGTATATLDHDNVGGIDVAPNDRVENIIITGVPATGIYEFSAHDFNNYNVTGPISYTLTTSGNGGITTQVQTGTLSGAGTYSPYAVVTHP
jgi:hypothetical protein